MIQRFQNDTNIKVFLLTHKTAAEGLTLTAVSRIVFMEPCSNKEVFQQSLDVYDAWDKPKLYSVQPSLPKTPSIPSFTKRPKHIIKV